MIGRNRQEGTAMGLIVGKFVYRISIRFRWIISFLERFINVNENSIVITFRIFGKTTIVIKH